MESLVETENLPFFGRLALQSGLVTLDQIQECVAVQLQAEAKGQPRIRLGELLVSKGYLTPEQVESLLKQQKESEPPAGQPAEINLAEGEKIFCEGDDSHDLYILLRGKVEAYRNGILIGVFDKSGIFLGETSALLKKPRSTTVQAKTACRLYRIPQARVELFFRSKPAMALRLAELMAERLDDILHAHVGTESTVLNRLTPPRTIRMTLAEDRKTLTLEEALHSSSLFLNGYPAEGRTLLQDGDTLQFGPHTFSVRLNDPDGLPIDEMEGREEDLPESEVADERVADSAPAPEVNQPKPSELIGGEMTSVTVIENFLEGIQNKPFLPEVVKAVGVTVRLYEELDRLEQRRKEVEAPWTKALPEREIPAELKVELDRQRRERSRFPQYSALTASAEQLTRLLKKQAAESESSQRTDSGDGVEKQTLPALSPELMQALPLGLEQKQILIRRSKHLAEVIPLCARQTVDEPLYRVLSSLSVKSHRLFGWATYAQALQELQEKQRVNQEHLREKKKSQLQEKKGLLSKLRKNGEKEEELSPLAQLELEEEKSKIMSAHLLFEVDSIEREMVDEFWDVYRETAKALVAGRIADGDQPFVRAFLRWGLLGCAPRFIDRTLAIHILQGCTEWVQEAAYNLEHTNILYSDEVIELSAQGRIPASPNEDLELNHRNSGEWKADRSLRRIINCRIRSQQQQEVLENLLVKLSDYRQELSVSEKRENLINPNSLTNKAKLNEQRQETQSIKVNIGRYERLIEKMREEMLPKLNEESRMAQISLEQAGAVLSPEDLAIHEVECTRRFCRLVAKLKEPFLPFTLQNLFKPEAGVVNTRDDIRAALADVELRDPLLFREPLVTVNKRSNRVLVRYSPIVVISPCNGIMGYMVNPRSGLENGRFILPGYMPRSNFREGLLWDVLSDLRFDTSKASAGVDIMNSETLVAAYALIRWDMRKRDREARQKAGIYTEENERTNWRRHYEWYMKSAHESGKQLFYKCPELYELIIDKYIDLPDGKEKLKH